MITIERMFDRRDGSPLLGFYIRNRAGRELAIGATGHFCQMSAPRYEHDKPLVDAVARLAGIAVRPIPNKKGK